MNHDKETNLLHKLMDVEELECLLDQVSNYEKHEFNSNSNSYPNLNLNSSCKINATKGKGVLVIDKSVTMKMAMNNVFENGELEKLMNQDDSIDNFSTASRNDSVNASISASAEIPQPSPDETPKLFLDETPQLSLDEIETIPIPLTTTIALSRLGKTHLASKPIPDNFEKTIYLEKWFLTISEIPPTDELRRFNKVFSDAGYWIKVTGKPFDVDSETASKAASIPPSTTISNWILRVLSDKTVQTSDGIIYTLLGDMDLIPCLFQDSPFDVSQFMAGFGNNDVGWKEKVLRILDTPCDAHFKTTDFFFEFLGQQSLRETRVDPCLVEMMDNKEKCDTIVDLRQNTTRYQAVSTINSDTLDTFHKDRDLHNAEIDNSLVTVQNNDGNSQSLEMHLDDDLACDNDSSCQSNLLKLNDGEEEKNVEILQVPGSFSQNKERKKRTSVEPESSPKKSRKLAPPDPNDSGTDRLKNKTLTYTRNAIKQHSKDAAAIAARKTRRRHVSKSPPRSTKTQIDEMERAAEVSRSGRVCKKPVDWWVV